MWTVEIWFCGMHVTDENWDSPSRCTARVRELLEDGITAPLGNHFEADSLELKVYRSSK